LIRALFFDFDGLILDTETPEVRAWEKMFESYGLEYPAQVWQNIVGRGPDQVEEQPNLLLKRLAGLEESPESIHDRFREIYFQILKHEARPGAENLIRSVPSAKYIVSSSDDRWVSGHLEKLGLKDQFSNRFTRDYVKRTKPAPDLYLYALEQTGLGSQQVWALEDSENGLRAAKAAGIRTVVCPNPTTQHLDFSLADRVVESLEILDWHWFENA
jgi:HAD superfamily hydrolase (TIGR01509 family)